MWMWHVFCNVTFELTLLGWVDPSCNISNIQTYERFDISISMSYQAHNFVAHLGQVHQ